jgi:hypothetical protein
MVAAPSILLAVFLVGTNGCSMATALAVLNRREETLSGLIGSAPAA